MVVHALAALDFCRLSCANLLPLARGLLYFGTSAPIELIAYNCWIGNTPSYSTIYHAYEGLSRKEAADTKAHRSNPKKLGFFIINNVQNYARVCNHRIGRENKMNVGIAGLYIEGEGAGLCIKDFGLADHRERISRNKRKTVTVEDLLGFLDQEDSDRYDTYQWVEALIPVGRGFDAVHSCTEAACERRQSSHISRLQTPDAVTQVCDPSSRLQ